MLNLYGQDVPVGAEILEMGQFSAHAGKSELLRWLTGLPAPPKQTYLTHGEPEAAQALQGAIQQKFQWKAAVARYLDTVPSGRDRVLKYFRPFRKLIELTSSILIRPLAG